MLKIEIEIHVADVIFCFYFRIKDDIGKTCHGLRIETLGKQQPLEIRRKHQQYYNIITAAASFALLVVKHKIVENHRSTL